MQGMPIFFEYLCEKIAIYRLATCVFVEIELSLQLHIAKMMCDRLGYGIFTELVILY